MTLMFRKKPKAFYLVATSDVAFLLLIFLVVTSSLEYNQQIQPPEMEYTEVLNNASATVVIEVTKEGEYYISNYSVSLSDVNKALSSTPQDAIIKIFADQDIDFSYITNLLTSLKEISRNNVFLMLSKEVDE